MHTSIFLKAAFQRNCDTTFIIPSQQGQAFQKLDKHYANSKDGKSIKHSFHVFLTIYSICVFFRLLEKPCLKYHGYLFCLASKRKLHFFSGLGARKKLEEPQQWEGKGGIYLFFFLKRKQTGLSPSSLGTQREPYFSPADCNFIRKKPAYLAALGKIDCASQSP